MTAIVTVATCCGSVVVAAPSGAALVAVATFCGSVAMAALRGASLVAAAALPVARGALDERRLIGMGASDLSTLGREGGMVGVTV
jgi:hypothetical protein